MAGRSLSKQLLLLCKKLLFELGVQLARKRALLKQLRRIGFDHVLDGSNGSSQVLVALALLGLTMGQDFLDLIVMGVQGADDMNCLAFDIVCFGSVIDLVWFKCLQVVKLTWRWQTFRISSEQSFELGSNGAIQVDQT